MTLLSTPATVDFSLMIFSIFSQGKKNYRCYYVSRDLVSPVCGIFFKEQGFFCIILSASLRKLSLCLMKPQTKRWGLCQHTSSSRFGQKGSELKCSFNIPIELYVSWFEWNICEFNLDTLEHPAIPISPSTLVNIRIQSLYIKVENATMVKHFSKYRIMTLKCIFRPVYS